MKKSKLFAMVSSWIARIRQGKLTHTDLTEIREEIPTLSLKDINTIMDALSNAIKRMRPKCDTYNSVLKLLKLRQEVLLSEREAATIASANVKVDIEPEVHVLPEEPVAAPVEECSNVKEVLSTFMNIFSSTQSYNSTCMLFLAQDETASGLVASCIMHLDGYRTISYTAGDSFAEYRDSFICDKGGLPALLDPNVDFANESRHSTQAIAAIEWHLAQAEYLELSNSSDIASLRDSVSNAIQNSIDTTQQRVPKGYVFINMKWVDNELVIATSESRLCIKRNRRF